MNPRSQRCVRRKPQQRARHRSGSSRVDFGRKRTQTQRTAACVFSLHPELVCTHLLHLGHSEYTHIHMHKHKGRRFGSADKQSRREHTATSNDPLNLWCPPSETQADRIKVNKRTQCQHHRVSGVRVGELKGSRWLFHNENSVMYFL